MEMWLRHLCEVVNFHFGRIQLEHRKCNVGCKKQTKYLEADDQMLKGFEPESDLLVISSPMNVHS